MALVRTNFWEDTDDIARYTLQEVGKLPFQKSVSGHSFISSDTKVWIAATRDREDPDPEPGTRRSCNLIPWQGNETSIPFTDSCILCCLLTHPLQDGSPLGTWFR